MKLARAIGMLIVLSLLASCNFPSPSSTRPTLDSPPTLQAGSQDETSPPRPSATSTMSGSGTSPTTPVIASATPDAGPGGQGRPEEVILILEPGPGSRLTSPVHVAGIADPTFEQTLGVRIVLVDGTELVAQPVNIAAEIGVRGPFSGDVPFTVSGENQAFIQVYDVSARDGGVIHLASVGVTLTGAGPEDITPVEPRPEQIVIFDPESGETISGGLAHVEGFALAGFEQTLLVEVYNIEGVVVGSQPVMVNAPDIGLPGPFSADVPYAAAISGPGRIVVRDVSPAFGGDSHLSSVGITLEP